MRYDQKKILGYETHIIFPITFVKRKKSNKNSLVFDNTILSNQNFFRVRAFFFSQTLFFTTKNVSGTNLYICSPLMCFKTKKQKKTCKKLQIFPKKFMVVKNTVFGWKKFSNGVGCLT